MKQTTTTFLKYFVFGPLAISMLCGNVQARWNSEWTQRKKITLDATSAGANIADPIGAAPVLIRLHDGNFQFAAAKENGEDLRFIAADDKTVLPHHIEKYDAVLNEAFVWVNVPDLKPGASADIWLYYGNAGNAAVKAEDAKGTYDGDTVLAYHFGEKGSPAMDATSLGNNAENAGLPMEGSLIGTGMRLDGKNGVTIPASPSLAWSENGAMTWSAWIKPTALKPNAVLFSCKEEGKIFRIGMDNGVPYAEVVGAGSTHRSASGEPSPVNIWRHLAVVAAGPKIALYVDGEPYATADAGLPAMTSPLLLGGEDSFVGEMDELEIAKVARPAGFIKLAAISQGGERAAKLLQFGEDEIAGGHNPIGEHLSLITDISKSLTFDGWVVIFLCTILAGIGGVVAVRKFIYLNRIHKGTEEFLKRWREVASDLTVLDHTDSESIKSLAGSDAKTQRLMRQSPLYHIYHIGSEEIRNRISRSNGSFKGLSGRSIQAIRASLDGGLVRETQTLHGNLIFLTIGIAGGPYLGLLGTVIGVMITFAVIAKTGEVEVNSIAPGIAGALLATVAGLAVAIPALFAYSYLNARIKEAVSTMQIFIDEFVTKMAELYPSESE